MDIIEQVEEGTTSRQAIASKYGIGKSTVHDIHKRRDTIRMFAMMCGSEDVGKRRRVDVKTVDGSLRDDGTVLVKQTEDESADEEIINSIEEYDYQEINDQEYEVVYEAGLCTEDVEVDDKSKKKKRKSRTLTFREKYDVIQQIESGAPVAHICESYGIGRTTVYDYLKRKQEIFDFVDKSNDVDRKTFKKSKFPEVEDKILQWCEANDSFTKAQFNQFARFALEEARDLNSSLNGSGIGGGWSWAKRFFNRHPELKQKLMNEAGAPVAQGELLISNTEYAEENEENLEESNEISANQEDEPGPKKIKYLNLGEKLEVLNDFDDGMLIAQIATKYDVSKSTIYDIHKRRFELRNHKFSNLSYHQKVSKAPRYPLLELELLQWCLKQKNYPLGHMLIADKARCIFDELEISGYFSPSSAWAKKFVLRHPDLYEKQGISVETENISEECFQETFYVEEEISEDQELNGNECESGDYEEEYIIEEIETPCSESIEDEAILLKPEVVPNVVTIIKKIDDSCAQIPDTIALKSLKILIKYSEQRGHDGMLSQFINYQSLLEKNVAK